MEGLLEGLASMTDRLVRQLDEMINPKPVVIVQRGTPTSKEAAQYHLILVDAIELALIDEDTLSLKSAKPKTGEIAATVMPQLTVAKSHGGYNVGVRITASDSVLVDDHGKISRSPMISNSSWTAPPQSSQGYWRARSLRRPGCT